MSETRVLQSWKEIAHYLKRGVRTVQRWESMFGLPVHRPAGRSRSAVLALTDELDRWISSTSLLHADGDDRPTREQLEAQVARLQIECARLSAELELRDARPAPKSIRQIAS